MKSNLPVIFFGAAVGIAAVVALARGNDAPTTSSASAPPAVADHPALPSGHPALAAGSSSMIDPSPGSEAPQTGLTWTAPARWQKVPHASTMRIATYRIPHADGDAEDAELSVTRAGGDTEANIVRWLGQFDEAGSKAAKRSRRVVAGLEVEVVEVHGRYVGMGSEPQTGFALLGAIVKTPGTSHFFKLTGPQKTVAVARAEFDALLSSVH